MVVSWAKARLVILAVLLAVFASIAYSRGFGMRLGGAPASLQGPYSSEEAWVVGEIVRDISGMSLFPARLSAEPVVDAILSQPGRYRVSANQGSGTDADLDLTRDLWAPASFRPCRRSVPWLGCGRRCGYEGSCAPEPAQSDAGDARHDWQRDFERPFANDAKRRRPRGRSAHHWGVWAARVSRALL